MGGTVDGRVFGGANQNKGDYTNIVMTGGYVKEGVFGGCNTSGTIGYTVTMKINGGQIGGKVIRIAHGGYGALIGQVGRLPVHEIAYFPFVQLRILLPEK